PLAEERNQTLSGNSSEKVQVLGDGDLLMQLFANLVENGLRHTPEGSNVAVALTNDGSAAHVVVTDDGPGIPAAMRASVFKRFVRLDSSRTTPGNGLGLSLAGAVAKLHGTRVVLVDNGPGLRAKVSLPLIGYGTEGPFPSGTARSDETVPKQ